MKMHGVTVKIQQ